MKCSDELVKLGMLESHGRGQWCGAPIKSSRTRDVDVKTEHAMKLWIHGLCVLCLIVATAVRAQQPQQPHEPARDPIGESFIPPELLMQNQEAIGLTEEQRQSLHAELEKAHARFGELQEQLQKENEALAALLKKDQADEAKA